jgi:hypothetical protein
MLRILLASSLLFTATLFSQVTVSYQLIQSYTVQDINNVINDMGVPSGILAPQYGVDFYRVIYKTEYRDSIVEVSGAMMIPKNMTCPAPLTSYQHGTTSKKLQVPSYNGEEKNICLIFAAEGNVVVAPDHVGLGASTINIHPYMHGLTEAHATINLMRAAREIIPADEDIDVELSNQIFLFGYSQGGTSTCHAAKVIEELYSEEFKVTAIAPLSGAYNLAGAQTDFINNGQPYATPGYLPYIIMGYRSIYPELYENLSDIFIEPYATIFPNLFFGHNYSMGYINNQCAPIPLDMIQPAVRDQFIAGTHAFNEKLNENDLLNWVPQTRVVMAYCTGDEQVHYTNAINAHAAWSSTSNYPIEAVEIGPQDHGGCVMFALLIARFIFSNANNNGIDIELSYNASTNQIELIFPNNNSADYSILWSTNHDGLTLENVDPSVEYSVTITNLETGCQLIQNVSVAALTANIDQNLIPDFQLFPNPVKDNLIIRMTKFANYNIQIINSLGETIFMKSNVHASEIIISSEDFPPGTYFVFVNNEHGKTSLPFVKQ